MTLRHSLAYAAPHTRHDALYIQSAEALEMTIVTKAESIQVGTRV